MTKDVIDAVNELEGELGSTVMTEGGVNLFFNELDIVYVTFDQRYHQEPYYQYICTIKEFNEAVKSTKELDMDIWKNAPDGATHYGYETETHYKGFYKILDVSDGFWHDGSRWLMTESWPDITPKPEVKPTPVYTKEMADNGVFPVVGMECLVLNTNCSNPKYIKALIKYVGQKVVYNYMDYPERCDNVKTLKFKPLDTRTDKEKAIDDMYKSLNKDDSRQGGCDDLFDDIKAGKIHGVSFQPLTVEVK
tara:strand:+ start:1325 stop:2071 length:747 start_codon:yes stop_codon:yes gene_type:complete